MNEKTVTLIGLRDALVRKHKSLSHQRDFPIVEIPVLEECIDALNRKIEGLGEPSSTREELRAVMLDLTYKLGTSLMAAETDDHESHYAAKAEELMHTLDDLRKRLASL